MFHKDDLTFKIASDKKEFNQIHKLNYETFVEEIPQHKKNSSEFLIDKFHNQNTYIICLKKSELIGMIAVRANRPFSLDCKLKDLDKHIPKYKSACEIRLLSIKKDFRNRKVLSGLFTGLAGYCEESGYDLALISATTRELSLYKKLGFKEFGSLVGKNKALYQPMYLTFDSYNQFKKITNVLKINANEKINFLPGPATVSSEVEKAFKMQPVSHRSKQFLKDFNTTRKLLCKLSGSKNVEIFMGSGTLANDVVAAQISLVKGKGLILSNGHFGERLIDHANRFSLDFNEINFDWGKSFDYSEIERAVKKNHISWIWFVHCETSTGVLNDLEKIKVISKEHSLKLCVDCVSSIGTYPFNLESLYLASGVSGKALCSYPGVSFVFYNHELDKISKLPRYLDLSFYKHSNGVPFTISSNLVYALKKTLETINVDSVYKLNKKLMSVLREKLSKLNIEVLSPLDHSCESYLSLKPLTQLKSQTVGEELEEKGFFLNYRSEYLLDKNLIQIALLGQKKEQDIHNLFLAFKKIL